MHSSLSRRARRSIVTFPTFPIAHETLSESFAEGVSSGGVGVVLRCIIGCIVGRGAEAEGTLDW